MHTRPEADCNLQRQCPVPVCRVALQELIDMHSTACEKHPVDFDAFLLVKILHTNTFSLPANETYLSKVSFFSYELADRRGTLAARAKAHAQCVAHAAKTHFFLKKKSFCWRRRQERRVRLLL